MVMSASADQRAATVLPSASAAALRVLHLYAGNLYGGVERFLATLARERAAAPAMQSHFALCFEGRLSLELCAAGAPAVMLGPARVSRPWTVVAARRALRRLLAQEQFDVAVCNSAWPHALFAPEVRGAGLPLVYWAHSPPATWHWLDRWANRTPPDLLVANSHHTLASYVRMFGACGDRRVLRCPVAPPPVLDREAVRRRVRAELATPAADVVIVCTSRLERWKGHEPLLEAMGRMRDDARWSAWICGGPQRPHEQRYFDELRRLARERNLADRVKFLGQRADVSDVLCAADIHCQPNTGAEPFGIAFVEAMYAGLPVVTTRLGAAPEIVTDGCGILVPPADVDALEAALRRLIRDPAARRMAARAGPDRAAELCGPAVAMRQIEQALSDVVVRARRTPRAPVSCRI